MTFSGFGHKPDELGGYSKDVLAKLIAFAVETIPQFGPTKIISGMSLGWEQALAMAAIELGLPLIAALPFEGQESVWPEKAQLLYKSILFRASQVKIVCSGKFDPKKFYERDQWIIDNSEGVFVLWNKWENPGNDLSDMLEANPSGMMTQIIVKPKNTNSILRRTLEYAEMKDRRIQQLWPLWETWGVDVAFENFRDSMLDISLYEG